MRAKTIVLVMAAAVFMLVSNATAAQDLVETVAKGCEKELTSYCKDVTPGEGRILACLYAHSDKLSGKC
ncbi:MAG: cysteine rich repeat-containing protein, partial [Desulfobulbales bacterium]